MLRIRLFLLSSSIDYCVHSFTKVRWRIFSLIWPHLTPWWRHYSQTLLVTILNQAGSENSLGGTLKLHQELIILEKMKNVETRIAFLKNYGKNEFRLVPKALETRNERHFSVIMFFFLGKFSVETFLQYEGSSFLFFFWHGFHLIVFFCSK